MAAPATLAPAFREPRSLAERAYRQLVRLITRLELPPGSLIVEKELTLRLGIGRTPVREALQRLAIEGLVVHQPNRGMFVTDVTTAGVQNIYEFRSIIDGNLVRLAAQRATAEQRRHLLELHDRFVAASRAGNIDDYVELDRCFYGTLAAAAQNEYLTEVVPRIFNLHLRLWFYISVQRGGWQDVADAHAEMAGRVARAIAQQEPDDAQRAITSYIARRHQDMRDLLWEPVRGRSES
ncbi:MAG: GntR family transcriptional regulator [Hyphomicrobiaceae bacterium]|nr:GntR family transcriptional regulator [Hyphomicrobiaceae bacterium]